MGEEPLKAMLLDPAPYPNWLPACVVLSRMDGTQLILSRLANGKAFAWHLYPEGRQLVHECELTTSTRILDTTDSGTWIAIVTHENNRTLLNIFSYVTPAGLKTTPTLVWSESRSPVCMAIQDHQESGDSPICRLAFFEMMP